METQVKTPKTEKRAKVTSANFKKEWSGKYGTMFDHNIEFENGDKGVYTSKKREQESFKVGDEAAYTIETIERGGYENTVIKPVMEFKMGLGKSSPRNYRADFISFAASYTKDIIVGGKAELKDFRKVFNTMYSVMDEKYNEINGASSNGASN